MFCWVYPRFHCSLPCVPVVLSQKAFCVEQTGSNLRISLQTPTGMPGEHPNTSQKQLFKWSRAASRGCVCSSPALWASGPASSGTKPRAQMFALLAGSPKSSCLLIDDNVHNDTTQQMLPGMRKSGSSPCHPLLVGRILIDQQAGNKDSKSQKVSDPTMPIITTANVNTQEGERRAWCTH